MIKVKTSGGEAVKVFGQTDHVNRRGGDKNGAVAPEAARVPRPTLELAPITPAPPLGPVRAARKKLAWVILGPSPAGHWTPPTP